MSKINKNLLSPAMPKMLNPYEKAGYLHNEGLDLVASGITDNLAGEQALDQLIQATASLISAKKSGNPTSDLKAIADYEHIVQVTERWNDYLRNKNNPDWIKKLELNKGMLFFAKKLLAINETLPLPDQKAQVIQIEEDILAWDCPDKNKRLPLLATAVGKHSIQYWDEVETVEKRQDTTSPKSIWKRMLTRFEKNDKIKGIWKADVAGAFTGGAASLIKMQSIGDILIETAVGAVIGSAAKVLFKEEK